MLKKYYRQHGKKTGEEKYGVSIVLGKMVFSDYKIQQQHNQHAENDESRMGKQEGRRDKYFAVRYCTQ
jgi:hypothetical protein